MRKLNVAILAGGRSSEHDISRLSASSIINALDRSKYEPIPILIERSGDWRLTTTEKLALHSAPTAYGASGTALLEANSGSDSAGDAPSVTTAAAPRHRGETRPATVTNPSNALTGIDVIFPVLHGPYGEDGTIQGLLETAGVPYVGNGVLASALGMDKALFKAVLRDAGIPVAPGDVAHAGTTDVEEFIASIVSRFGFPLFVKPARLGSSIGISKATTADELRDALTLAFQHDPKVLVEAFIEGIEVECGVLGNAEPMVSVPGEVRINADAGWYDFETKYHEGNMELVIPAAISDEASARVRELALAVFRAIDCTGLARVDCFVTADGNVIVNELNTMPGFTATSAFAKLFEASGYSYNAVVDALIELAMDRHRAAN